MNINKIKEKKIKMKKVVKVLACLLSPLALVSCSCKSKEIKFEVSKEGGEAVVDEITLVPAAKDAKVEGDVKEVKFEEVSYEEIGTNNSKTSKTAKNVAVKVKATAKASVKPIKYTKICKKIGEETKCLKEEKLKEITDESKLVDFITSHSSTSFEDVFEGAKK